jgi:hypothetical protein
VRTGSPFRRVRINVNTASFSSPVAPCPRGYFHADPEDRILTLEVTDGNCDRAEVAAELNAPVRTFLAYMAAHPPTAVATSERGRIDVPWEAWGPHGAHLVRPPDQRYIFYRPRTCGMRVLGAPLLGKKSVVITDYHPGRVARSVGLDPAARVRARASPEIRKGPQLRHASLTCVTKEVPLPEELQEISNLWVILCEDALLVFEVSCVFFFLTPIVGGRTGDLTGLVSTSFWTASLSQIRHLYAHSDWTAATVDGRINNICDPILPSLF